MMPLIDKEILRNVVKNASTDIALSLSSTLVDIEPWFSNFCNIVSEFYKSYGHVVFAFEISPKADAAIPFTVDVLNDMRENGRECAVINLDNNISILSNMQNADILTVSGYGFASKIPIVRVDGELVEIFIEGRLVNRVNVTLPASNKEKRIGKYSRSHREYKLLIDDHSTKQLINCMDKYWESRKDRILKSGKTELIFQSLLHSWFFEHLYDAKAVIEVKTNAGDRTDIDIYAYESGYHYIIEIKWLGKNAKGTEYKIDRVYQGLKQISTYIEREANVHEAYLVCYDGRQLDECSNESCINESAVPAKGGYKLIFLESQTASEKGTDYGN